MPTFSPELELELGQALRAYAISYGAPSEAARLQRATERVCRESHALAMLPEHLVIELKRLYLDASGNDVLQFHELRQAYDRLLTGCIEAYFAAAAPRAGNDASG